MAEYLITALAGREVAGIRNPGINEAIHLTPVAAEHALRLGHIVRAPEKEQESESAVVHHPKQRAGGRRRRK